MGFTELVHRTSIQSLASPIRRLAYIRACTSLIAKGHDRVPAGPAGAVRKHRKTQPGELFIWEGFFAGVEKQDDKKYPPPHLLCVSVQ